MPKLQVDILKLKQDVYMSGTLALQLSMLSHNIET